MSFSLRIVYSIPGHNSTLTMPLPPEPVLLSVISLESCIRICFLVSVLALWFRLVDLAGRL